ncbi:MAG: hypothetical protein Ct9H300mP14_12440 [Gammaproteobacteria bacterium]|nr:MAG: hypothetical protein Ct9H300mP14_12440 [Gammaproteobacteria bacterium]
MRRLSCCWAGLSCLLRLSRLLSPEYKPAGCILSLETVERGTIEKTNSSTGRVKPVMTVDIGSQVSGQSQKYGGLQFEGSSR